MSFAQTTPPTLAFRSWALAVPFLMLGLASTVAQDSGVLIRLNAEQRPVVEIIAGDAFRPDAEHRGILIWSRGGQGERWQWVDERTDWPPRTEPRVAELGLAAATRGGAGALGTPELFAATVQLGQLETGTLQRGSVLVTPANNGLLLTTQPTFRRLPAPGEPRFPAAVARLTDQANRPVLKFTFAPGQGAVRWADIPTLPPAQAAGLAPGHYTVELEGLERSRFTVLAEQERARVLAPVTEMARLLAEPQSSQLLQFRVEHLLRFKDEHGNPQYLADALESLEAAGTRAASDYLQDLRGQLRKWLEQLARDPGYRRGGIVGLPPGDRTGIAAIDEARASIAAGRWSEAEQILRPIPVSRDNAQTRRTAGLRALYAAVIAAEAGLGRREDAQEQYRQALELLQDSPAADQIKAHTNYANFLLRQAQDRLNNHAFQIASGVRLPFLSALGDWIEAHEHYEAALRLTEEEKAPRDRAAVFVNLARLYALLADVVATFEPSAADRPAFVTVQRAAVAAARHWAGQPTEVYPGAELARGTAAEIQSHLAFRSGERELCQTQAQVALAHYTRAGYLAGQESVQRLLGLNAAEAGDSAAALRHLRVSHLLSELLRERFPQDEVGLSRAGFFSRRSYVFERIVELLIAAKEPAEALRFAELAKARAAQDVLTTGGLSAASEENGPGQEFMALLQAWPRGVAALEYFLGDRRAFVFVVDSAGKVQAFPIVDESGQPVDSRVLVAQVRSFLNGVENQAAKMARTILSGRGFDNAWQADLHRFYHQLIPAGARPSLRAARQVVVVPHHILHYFPFAALVTRLDEQPQGKLAMASPKFLIDEPYHLLYAPSLTVWDLLRQRPAEPLKRAQAVGIVEVPGAPPLPGVEKDLQNFQAVFGPAVKKVLQGDQARADLARKLLQESGVLLLATHGLNEPDRPLESYLLFLPATGPVGDVLSAADNGHLTARHIFGTRVGASMVVMSACFSGLGDRSPLPGDDLFGLQRAFLQAGARTVVSGLWDVYDGTAPDLIRGYFQRVAAGKPASHALAESQREFLAHWRASDKPEPYLHPYFWAVYTVAGDDSASGRHGRAP